jgi:hypothetical protein
MQIGSIGKHFMDINRESQHSHVKRKPFTASNFMKVLFQGIRNSKVKYLSGIKQDKRHSD